MMMVVYFIKIVLIPRHKLIVMCGFRYSLIAKSSILLVKLDRVSLIEIKLKYRYLIGIGVTILK